MQHVVLRPMGHWGYGQGPAGCADSASDLRTTDVVVGFIRTSVLPVDTLLDRLSAIPRTLGAKFPKEICPLEIPT